LLQSIIKNELRNELTKW